MGFDVQDRREAPPVFWAELRDWRFFEVAGLPNLQACLINPSFLQAIFWHDEGLLISGQQEF